MNRLILAATLALSAAPAHAFDLGAMTPTEKAAFGAAVKDYLMQNPEVLVEAINELESRQRAEAELSDKAMIAAYSDALYKDPQSWVGGNVDGDVTIVEFMDYRCGYCKKAYPEVEALLKKDGAIRFVVKEFPILGPQSEQAARFAIAVKQVAGDEPYGRVHNALMELRGDVTPENLKRLAETEKLDATAVLARMDAPEVTAVITANYALAQKMNLTGTPAFIIGDEILRGYAPFEAMQEMVEDARG